MSGLDLDNFKKNREAILKAEIGALLFNLGKTHIGFWEKERGKKKNEDDRIVYFEGLDFDSARYRYAKFNKYRDYLKSNNGQSPFDIEASDKKLENFFNTDVTLTFKYDKGKEQKITLDLKNIINGDTAIKDGGKYYNNFVDKILMQGCENVNSGIDKGTPRKQLQNLNIVNAFGSIMDEITNRKKGLVDKSRFDTRRLNFFKKLSEDKNLSDNKFSFDMDWLDIRNYIIEEIKAWYSTLLSDSRFPINDITLWDQAYMTASLFKAALAAMALEGEKYNRYYKDNPRSIKWSILGIQYDKLGLAEKAMNPVFIKWYREKVKDVDEKIKDVLEAEYALGNEIYRDETGIYFLVPENAWCEQSAKDNEKKYGTKRLSGLHPDLKEIEDKILDCFMEFEGEVFPAIFLTAPSRGTMNIAYLLETAKDNFIRSQYPEDRFKKYIGTVVQHNSFKLICDVCGFRLADKEKKQLKLCSVCFNRHDAVLQKKQTSNSKDDEQTGCDSRKETVWTGELQDKNGKIALITLKFELAQWLNGDMLNTMLINENAKDLVNEIKKVINGESINMNDSYLPKIVHRSSKKDLESLLLQRTIGDRWEDFLSDRLKDVIDFKNQKIVWQKLKNNEEAQTFLAKILLQFIIRKNPSPARFRRIWESTLTFFENIEKEMKTDGAAESFFNVPSWRCQRIKFKKIIKEAQYKNKEFEYRGLNFLSDNDGNLELISSIEQAIPLLKKEEYYLSDEEYERDKENGQKKTGKRIDFLNEEEKGKWIKEEKIRLVVVDDTKNGRGEEDFFDINLESEKVEYIPYHPMISIIDPTPISWQFIIPAQYVEGIVNYVKKKYDEHFQYVKGKLPLHIGVVVQDYKSPLYIGIKALRNIRRDIDHLNEIKECKTGKELKEIFEIHEEVHEKQDMDFEKKKHYSLFEQCEGEAGVDGCQFYLPDGQKGKQLFLKDVTQLDEQKKYVVYPNTFDFQFMDANIRRNDIIYSSEKRTKRLDKWLKNRPYTLEEWECFIKFKDYFKNDSTKTTKLQNAVSLIYAKLQDWDNEKEQIKIFMLSAFINIFGLDNASGKNEFAALFGLESWSRLETKDEEEFHSILLMFLDMFDFWHNCFKEI
ncbi:CRISPR-associated protein Csx11 [Anoxybacillus sp. UARK-01]|uniref:CRISPR-associated protein Csx11 n=1 Tax=Anoxybacillus sp. UARK-01 TaxID=1895648 RepID=UPI0009BAB9A0|nr:CRISPR-associated protein Csx11 [Anoxybacillus sp. UARK-01]OQM46682.1 CRISPR-associated protein Csx11 [Anoxybacillus sp. UARK-01]